MMEAPEAPFKTLGTSISMLALTRSDYIFIFRKVNILACILNPGYKYFNAPLEKVRLHFHFIFRLEGEVKSIVTELGRDSRFLAVLFQLEHDWQMVKRGSYPNPRFKCLYFFLLTLFCRMEKVYFF